MIRLSGLTLARAGRPLIEDAAVAIHAGERLALIGPNGSGKSSLLALLRGELAPDSGQLQMPAWRIGWLSQQPPQSDLTTIDHVIGADAALAAAGAGLAAAEASGDGLPIAAAHEAWLAAGGPQARSRAAGLLAGLGFDEAQMDAPVAALSGGWKMRLNLASVLMADVDLLLLDEPTNHLDLDAVLWLERQLVRLPSTQIIVSHDRDFLDRVAQSTLTIENRSLVRYRGGYSASEEQRAARVLARQRQRARDQGRRDHLMAFVERFRAKATKARQVQSRLKALEKMTVLAPARVAAGLTFDFADPPPGPDPLIVATTLVCGYRPTAPVVAVAELTVRRGARIGVLGRNGAGKSTLLRTLVGELPALAGEVVKPPNLAIGYLDQRHIEALRSDDSALDHLRRLAPLEREPVLRGFLGGFGFSADDALRPVGPMSGGEKSRLGLALLAWRKPGFLVLDEPTNHLDPAVRDALADALGAFDGALLLVSHDRYLLRATVDTLVVIDDGRLVPFEGDLDDYAGWIADRRRGSSDSPSAGAAPPGAAPAGARGDAGDGTGGAGADRRERARQRETLARHTRPVEERSRRIETLLARHQKRASALDQQLSDPAAFADPAQAAEQSRERAWLAGEIAKLEDEWLECQTELERLRQ